MPELPLISEYRDGRILNVVLNRPNDRNTIVQGMLEQLHQAIDRATRDAAVGVVVLRGAGKHFCAGGSLSSLASHATEKRILAEQTQVARAAAAATLALARLPKPTIAMIRGFAAGGGLALAAACDLRIAARGSRLSFAYTRIGLGGDIGATFFLTRVLGPAKMAEFSLLCPVLDAEAALAIGLVGRVVDDDTLEDETMAVAHQLAALSPIAVAAVKHNIDVALYLEPEAALAVEAQNFASAQSDPNHAEAARAFLEKRAPVFDYSGPAPTAASAGAVFR